MSIATPSRAVLIVLFALGAVTILGPSAGAQRNLCTDERNIATKSADAEYRKAQIDAQTERDDKLRECGNSSSCKREATLQYTEQMRNVIRDRDHRLADIRKQEIDCRLGATARPNTEQTPTADPDASPDGLFKLQTEIDNIRSNAIDNVLVAGDHLFKGALDWASGVLNSLAKPRGDFGQLGEPSRQILDWIVTHEPTSFAERQRQMEKAMADFERDPAYFLGKEAPNFLPMPSPGAAVTQARASVAAAARGLGRLNAAANRFARPISRLTPLRPARPGIGVTPTPAPRPPVDVAPPPLAGGRSPAPAPGRGRAPIDPGLPPRERIPEYPADRIPPRCSNNSCWPDSQSVDHYMETGEWLEPRPRPYATPTDFEFIARDLKAAHGGVNALDPMHGPGGQLAHSFGVPVVTTRAAIEEAMRALGPGTRGYVFFRWAQQVGTEVARTNHVAGVRQLKNGTTQFIDRATVDNPALKGAVEPELWNSQEIFFFRTR